MIIINFREYFYLYESIDQNFDQWLIDLKTHARPDESEIKTFNIPDNKKQFIINTLKSKNIENKQYMKYLIGFATTPQSSHIEDYDRAVDTLKWFIQTNRLTKAQVEADGWFNTGKRATELTREKDQILNPYSKTKEKKEKKLGIAEDILPLFQSGNIKIYFSPKATIERISKEDTERPEIAEKPEIKARHKILCKYGKGTDWCTASPTGTSHVMYADRNIYIVHIDDKPAYQFMDCSEDDTDNRCQFHDAKNASAESIPIDLALLIKEKLPKIASFYGCVKKTLNEAISNAIETNNLDLVKYLVEKGAKIVFDAVSNAAVTGNLELVEYLIKKGAKIGGYAVSNAAVTGNLDLVIYLIEKGGEIGKYAISNAASKGNLDIVKYLLGDEVVDKEGNVYKLKNDMKAYQISDAVTKAAVTGNLNLVKYLIEKGGEIGDAVYYAAGTGDLDLVEYLVKKGGEIEYDAISHAAKSGHQDIVDYLRSAVNRN
jgi:ankyrin repeat protein